MGCTQPTLPSVSYHSSKSAVLQMARSMACELGPQRIRVNTISPGFIKTRYVGSQCKAQWDADDDWGLRADSRISWRRTTS